MELYFQPKLIPGGFKYAELNKFMFNTGVRVVLPVWQKGEYLSFSLGSGYSYQKSLNGEQKGGPTYEGAVYFFFGMLGVKFNYNQYSASRYDFGIYFKYY